MPKSALRGSRKKGFVQIVSTKFVGFKKEYGMLKSLYEPLVEKIVLPTLYSKSGDIIRKEQMYLKPIEKALTHYNY